MVSLKLLTVCLLVTVCVSRRTVRKPRDTVYLDLADVLADTVLGPGEYRFSPDVSSFWQNARSIFIQAKAAQSIGIQLTVVAYHFRLNYPGEMRRIPKFVLDHGTICGP